MKKINYYRKESVIEIIKFSEEKSVITNFSIGLHSSKIQIEFHWLQFHMSYFLKFCLSLIEMQ